MPSRDSSGKRLPGSKQRAIKKRRIEHEQTRPGSAAAESSHFDSLPRPPIEDTAGLVRWGAQCLAVVMDRAIRDRSIFETERDQLRFVADCCAKLGMIRDKASEQEAIKKALQARRKEAKAAGLDDARQFAEPRVSRPPLS